MKAVAFPHTAAYQVPFDGFMKSVLGYAEHDHGLRMGIGFYPEPGNPEGGYLKS